MKTINANDIDLTKLNVDMKGMKVRVKPLFDIYNQGKQSGFGLNIMLKGAKKFSNSQFAPFYFSDEAEAEKAAGIINSWSVS